MDDRVILNNGKSSYIKFDLTNISSFSDFLTANNNGTLTCDIVANTDGTGTEVMGTPLTKGTLFSGDNSNRYAVDTPSDGFEVLVREWTVTVPASAWSIDVNVDGYYTNTVATSGMKALYTPTYALNETDATIIDDAISAFAEIKRMTTSDDSVTFLALDRIDTDIPIRIKGV